MPTKLSLPNLRGQAPLHLGWRRTIRLQVNRLPKLRNQRNHPPLNNQQLHQFQRNSLQDQHLNPQYKIHPLVVLLGWSQAEIHLCHPVNLQVRRQQLQAMCQPGWKTSQEHLQPKQIAKQKRKKPKRKGWGNKNNNSRRRSENRNSKESSARNKSNRELNKKKPKRRKAAKNHHLSNLQNKHVKFPLSRHYFIST